MAIRVALDSESNWESDYADQYSYITPMYRDYIQGWPDIEHAVEYVKELNRLAPVSSEVGSVPIGILDGKVMSHPMAAYSDLQNWESDAARDFRQSFLMEFADIAENQVAVVAQLGAALDAHRKLYERAYEDIETIAVTTRDALHDIASTGAAAKRDLFFSILTLSISMDGARAGGLAALNYSISVGDKVSSQYPNLGGEFPSDVVASMEGAIGALTGSIDLRKDEIVRFLEANVDFVRENPAEFRHPRPAIADDGSAIGPPPSL